MTRNRGTTGNGVSFIAGRVYHEVEAMTARGQVERQVRKAGVAITTERGYDVATGRLLMLATQAVCHEG